MNKYANAALQVVVGFVIVLFIFYFSLWVMQKDSLVATQSANLTDQKHQVLVIDGYIDSSQIAKKSMNTVNPNVVGYVPLPRSYNRMGGAQFSYAFWLFVGDTASAGLRNKDILLRGEDREYRYRKTTADGSRTLSTNQEIVTKCPRLRFGETFKDFVLEFNTQDEITHSVNLTAVAQATDVTIRHNLLELIQQKWVHFAFSMEDNVPINDFENGVVVRFYVNDILYYTHRVSSKLRQNNGDLLLFPAGAVPGCRIADLTYYNYALGFQEVKAAFSQGPPKKQANIAGSNSTVGRPLYLSKYNEVDLYNR